MSNKVAIFAAAAFALLPSLALQAQTQASAAGVSSGASNSTSQAATTPQVDNPTNNNKSVEEIRACSRANLPEKTMVQNMRLEPTDRAGKSREITASFFIKRFSENETRATLQVRAPLDVSGVSYLWVDSEESDQLFLYLPSLQRVRRVTGKTAANSMLGSDFSYEDIKHLRGISAGGEAEKLADTEFGGRPIYRLQLTQDASEESAYQRIVYGVDKATCVPLQIEFYETENTLRKRLTADAASLQKLGARWLATRLDMRDVKEGTHTRMEITEVEFDENINSAVFNRRGFYLGAYLQKPDTSAALSFAR